MLVDLSEARRGNILQYHAGACERLILQISPGSGYEQIVEQIKVLGAESAYISLASVRCFPVYYFLVSFGEFDRLQNLTPYLSGLLAYVRRGIVPFHTPGHKQGRALPSVLAECQEHWAALDLSDVVECPSLDHAEPLVLQAAERLVAELYGVHSTLFLSNGTSQGIIGMLLAAGFGRRVLLSGIVTFPRCGA